MHGNTTCSSFSYTKLSFSVRNMFTAQQENSADITVNMMKSSCARLDQFLKINRIDES